MGVPPSALLGWSIADDGRLLLAAITLMAWIAWVILAGTIVAETVSILTHRALPRVPLLGGLQGMVAGLVVAAIAVSAAPSNAYAAPGHRTTSSPVALLGQGPGPVARDLVAEPPPSTSVNSVAPDRQLLTVRQGDTLSDLAEKHLGDANRWPELYRANRERIDDPDLIQVGWRLILPSSLTDSRPEPATQRPKRRPPAPTGSDVPTPPAKPPAPPPSPRRPISRPAPRRSTAQAPRTHHGAPTADRGCRVAAGRERRRRHRGTDPHRVGSPAAGATAQPPGGPAHRAPVGASTPL
ncbi:MAG: LysM peptidoglycan-binding domain-containing protein [Micropruina sp.]|nr:MAG: LysM peptidoglycan-binding domain-containing protein [Micropruina sp.]